MTKQNILKLPENTQAILWDMDGVLIDSMSLDIDFCNNNLSKYFGKEIKMDRDFIQSIFAYDVPKFIELILEKISQDYNLPNALDEYQSILDEYDKQRQTYSFKPNPNIPKVLDTLKDKKMAVVSNNPQQKIIEVLENSNINPDQFGVIIGNDNPNLNKKPAPDTYLYAAKKLGLNPQDCTVIEDSEIGIKAGKAADCFVIGVSTGSLTFEELEELKKQNKVDEIYKFLEI